MGAKGSFDIPQAPSQSTAGARRAFRARFGHECRLSDNDIRRVAWKAASCAALLDMMQEEEAAE